VQTHTQHGLPALTHYTVTWNMAVDLKQWPSYNSTAFTTTAEWRHQIQTRGLK